MCNLSEGIYQDGINVGKKQGEELGMQKGKLLSAKIMLESGMELSYIAKKLELSEDLITEYIKNESNS